MQRAKEYFKEIQALCERDGGRLWVSAPTITRFVSSSRGIARSRGSRSIAPSSSAIGSARSTSQRAGDATES
jgi:hypothetical protein